MRPRPIPRYWVFLKKLIPSYMVGARDGGTATEFMQDLAGRLANRVMLTTDGHKMYLGAVEVAFAGEIDYAMLVKNYANLPSGPETRYSPAVGTGCEKHLISGNPESKRISTSYVERANLSMRMGLRRYTRLTNAHSKKLENHCAALAIYFLHYNFAKIQSRLPRSADPTKSVENSSLRLRALF